MQPTLAEFPAGGRSLLAAPQVEISVGSHESDAADMAGPLSPVFRSSSSVAVRDTARQARDKRRKDLLLDDEVRAAAARAALHAGDGRAGLWDRAAVAEPHACARPAAAGVVAWPPHVSTTIQPPPYPLPRIPHPRIPHPRVSPSPEQVVRTASMEGRAYSHAALLVYYAACVASLGIVWLVAQWAPRATLRATTRAVLRARDADVFIVTGVDGEYEVCGVEAVARLTREAAVARAGRWCGCGGGAWLPSAASIPVADRMLVFRHTRLVWDDAGSGGEGGFVLQVPEAFPPPTTLAGLTPQEAAARGTRSGPNAIELPLPSPITLFFREAIHPFFVFQIFAVMRVRWLGGVWVVGWVFLGGCSAA